MESTGVLYISYDGMTDNLGQSQVIPYLQGLSEKGYSIHLLSCEKPANFEKRQNHISKLLQKSGIAWHPIQYTAKPPIISTLYDLHKLQNKAVEIIKYNSIKLIHCRSYIAAHVGRYCQKKFSIPWIFDMRGFWADERVEGGIWNTSNILYKMVYRYFKSVEQDFIANSSHIISLTHAGEKEIRNWQCHKSNQTPITVIPCCADLQLFRFTNEKKEILSRKLNITDENFVISYLGSFGTWYMTDEMFDFFKVLHKKNEKSIFLCITPDNPDMLDSIALRKDIPRTALRVIKANREEVPLYASLSDWSMFFIKPVYSKKASSPTKMGELLSMGIPLVCNAGVGDVEEIMHDCPTGFVVKDFTTEEYGKIANSILSHPAVDRDTLHSVAEKYYSLSQGIELYGCVYKQILAK